MTDKKMGMGFGIMILKDNKVLLGKRHDDPEKADSLLHGEGQWTMPGGKLHFGEDLQEAAAREVEEETGLKVDPKHLKLISITNDIVSTAHFMTSGWLCTEFEGEPQVLEPDEITKWEWFDIKELPSPMYKSSEKLLKNYLDGTIYKH